MRVVTCGKREIKEYIRFTRELYQGDKFYKDSLTPILNMVLFGRSEFCTNAALVPVMVKDDAGHIQAVCTYITTPKLPGMLQVAFFEARPKVQVAVDMLLEAAREKCRQENLHTILVGLNGHVNYGLGFLADSYDSEVCFGNSYNPSYYPHYFRKYNPMEHVMVSYLTDMNRFNLERESRILERINQRFTFREASFKNLRREVEIYTLINNLAFGGHPFFFERTVEEDFELLNEFKPFIKGENLIIAEKDGEPIGLMLWYPDFNQLIQPGKGMGVDTFIRNKFAGHKINKFKIAEIAVLPKYQGSGAILGLFNKCMQLTKGRYDWCETSWIFDDNLKSKGFGINWADSEYKHYTAFEIKL